MDRNPLSFFAVSHVQRDRSGSAKSRCHSPLRCPFEYSASNGQVVVASVQRMFEHVVTDGLAS